MAKITKKPKKISNYWQNRLLEQQNNLWNNVVGQTEAEIAQQYLRLEKKVENELNRLWLEIIKDKGTPEFNTADLYKHQRYYELLEFIREQLNKNGTKQYQVMEKKFTDLYKDNYKIVSKYYGSISNRINEEKMRLVIDEYWAGNANFSSRIWTNQALLNESIKNSIIDVVTLGEPHTKAAMAIMKDFGVSYNNAVRLVRTEATRIQNESTFQRYKDSGITKYQFICADDERTCTVCGSLDGKIFDITDEDNIPPKNTHPFVDVGLWLC